MAINGRLHKTLALIIIIGLIKSLLPQPVWDDLFHVPSAHAANIPTHLSPLTDNLNTGLKSSLQEILPPQINSSLSPLALENQLGDKLMTPATLPTSPSDEQAASLSISRQQSAYAATGAISNTLIVTFTIHNNQMPALLPTVNPHDTYTQTLANVLALDYANDPNVIRNVILSDELLPPQATFVSASLPTDHLGQQYSWNLGDIPPLGTATLVLQLTIPASLLNFTELDTGATAWGTLQNKLVSSQAAPILLAPDSLVGWLSCTIDANCQDPYVIEKAAQLGNDPTAIFEYVRSLGYESYKGSLRGARGTLWSEAGNSVDQASLLVALLRASGIPAAYRHGTFAQTDPHIATLINAMFPTTASAVAGSVPDGTPLSDPANDPFFIEETLDHWWVQAYLPSSGWTHLDPSFVNAAIGDTFITSPEPAQLAELPDNLRHKVTVKLKLEEYHPLNVGGPAPSLDISYPLNHTFNTVELVGETLSLGHFVNSNANGGFVFYTAQHSYVPYLILGQSEQLIEGEPFMEMISNFPLGTFLITGQWLIFDVIDSDGNIETYERELFDHLGFEARQGGGTIAYDASQQGTNPSISDQSSHTTLFAPSMVPPDALNTSYQQMVTAVTTSQTAIDDIQDILNSDTLSNTDLERLQEAKRIVEQATRLSQRTHLLQFAATSDLGVTRLGQSALVKPYYDSPRIFTVSWVRDEPNNLNKIMFDLRRNDIRAISYPGQTWQGRQGFNIARGLVQSTLETQLLQNLGNEPVLSVYNIFQAAQAQDIPLVTITPANPAAINDLNISNEAKARLNQSIGSTPGLIAIVPASNVTIGNQETIGWFLIDTISGETTDMMENGQHPATLEYGLLISVPSFQQLLFAIIGFFHGFAAYGLAFLGEIMGKMPFDNVDLKTAWGQSIDKADQLVNSIIEQITGTTGLIGECFSIPSSIESWVGAYAGGTGYSASISVSFEVTAVDFEWPGWAQCADAAGGGGNLPSVPSASGSASIEISIEFGGFDNGANFAKAIIGAAGDPPIPGALYAIPATSVMAASMASASVPLNATTAHNNIDISLDTGNLTIAGPVTAASWASTAQHTFLYNTFSSASGTLYNETGALLGSGATTAVAHNTPATAIAHTPTATYHLTAADSTTAYYAPALTGLAAATNWQTLYPTNHPHRCLLINPR